MAVMDEIVAMLNARKNRVLLYAQAALPDQQFAAFKKLFLDEFGMRGLESELAKLFKRLRSEDGLERNGQEYITQERRRQND